MCTDANGVLAIIALFFKERFALSYEETFKLRVQLRFYFSQRGITNEQMLSAITLTDSWPKPEKLATVDNALNFSTVPIILLLSHIALYTGRILR